MNKSRRAVFVDRDGTLIKEKDHLTSKEQVEMLPGVSDAIRQLNQSGFLVLMITNQSVVGRGMITETELIQIHKYLLGLLDKENARLDGIYYCPHHPDDHCHCRKPETGLIEQALCDFKIDLRSSFIIGDHIKDIQVSRKIGCHGILVCSGHGRMFKDEIHGDDEYVFDNLMDAVQFIRNF